MEKANYTSVVDTPEIIHAHQVKNLSSKVMMVFLHYWFSHKVAIKLP